MSTKGDKTKKAILDACEKLFADRGYTAVTMKDVCTVSGISRGGLYRHFSSTKAILIAMLDQDIDQNRIALEEGVRNNTSAKTMFSFYLQHEMDAILSSNRGIFFAIHEFAFAEKEQRDYLKRRLEDSLEILGNLFEYGQKKGEFKAFDIEVVTNHIIYFFDSLKTLAPIFSPDKVMIENQIRLIKELVI